MCAGVRPQPTHPAPPPSLPLLLLLQACESPHSSSSSFRTPQHRRQNSDAYTSDSVSWAPRPQFRFRYRNEGQSSSCLSEALDFPPSIIPASCHMLAFSINLCLLLKGGKAQIIGPEEEYEDDYSYAFNDVSGDGSLSSSPPGGSLAPYSFIISFSPPQDGRSVPRH